MLETSLMIFGAILLAGLIAWLGTPEENIIDGKDYEHFSTR